MKLVIIGIYPPPIGGISMHFKRLVDMLEKSDIKFILFNLNHTNHQYRSKSIVGYKHKFYPFLKLFFCKSKFDIIHLSTGSSYKLRLSLGLLRIFLNKPKFIITHHGYDVTWPFLLSNKSQNDYRSFLISKLVIFLFTKFHFHICVNTELRQKLLDYGIKKDNIAIIPAFLPPTEEETDVSLLPEGFIDIRNKYKFFITANACSIVFHEGRDLYGIDIAIELTKLLLKNGYNDFLFLFVIANVNNTVYMSRSEKFIASNNLQEHFFFCSGNISYPAILNISDIFIRPTITDGDALSIREALHLKVPVIASDCVTRPPGVLTFKTRDVHDLFNVIVDVFANYAAYKSHLDSVRFESNFEKLVATYNKIVFD